jgi:type II restriction enzyme
MIFGIGHSHALIAFLNLNLPTFDLQNYKSASQRARVGTESWGASHLFCSSCESPRLVQALRNAPAIDYVCPMCQSTYQLKSQWKPFGTKIIDSAYSEMRKAILEDRTPNLFILQYDLGTWTVRTVILIPRFAFALSAIECRKPLAATARRAGWVGCNILLARIPQDARIPVVQNGSPRRPLDVRRAYDKLRPFEELKVQKRGWTLDVLNVVRSLEKAEFNLSDIYSHAATLTKLHPHNAHVREKIRQQLQVLRDLGFLHFLGSGLYRIK